jgi:hypothetical protein
VRCRFESGLQYNAPVAQPAEATDLKPVQLQFESALEYTEGDKLEKVCHCQDFFSCACPFSVDTEGDKLEKVCHCQDFFSCACPFSVDTEGDKPEKVCHCQDFFSCACTFSEGDLLHSDVAQLEEAATSKLAL